MHRIHCSLIFLLCVVSCTLFYYSYSKYVLVLQNPEVDLKELDFEAERLLITSLGNSTRQQNNVQSNKLVQNTTEILAATAAASAIQQKNNPVILLWNATFPSHRWVLPNTTICGKGCEITNDRERFNDSDAVVFWMESTTHRDRDHPYMKYRRPEQAFAWWCGESAFSVSNVHRRDLHGYENFFNWSMHYRSDSDVINAMMPHSALDWFLHKIGRGSESSVRELKQFASEEEFNEMFDELLKVKKKGAAWLVSDCVKLKGAATRMKLAKRITSEGGYHFDTFGACTKNYLPRDPHKYFKILQEYKFYFAFENTFRCKDYVTEKFWYNGLYAGAVPVVLGPPKSNVERLAPPGSFIHLDDFGNDPKRLADFLRRLEHDDLAYKKYFRWWTMPGFYPIHKFREGTVEADRVSNVFEDFQVMGFCHLCRKLRNGDNVKTRKSIPDFWQDFFGKENKTCYEQRS